MALSIISQPTSVALAKNLLAIVLQTNNYVTTSGIQEGGSLILTNKLNAGQTITITWNGNTVVFTGAASPDQSGTQLPAVTGTHAVDSSYNNTLVQALLSNYELSNDFFITNPFSGSPVFQAKQPGAAYNITITTTVSGITTTGFGIGVDEIDRENFTGIVQVFVEAAFGSGIYAKADEVYVIPDGSLNMIFLLDSILLPFLGIDLPSTDIVGCANMMKRYYLRYGEQYGDDTPDTYLLTTMAVKLALRAGLSYQKFPSNTFVADYTVNTFARKFLTTQPRTKSINTSCREWLYYYNDQVSGTLTLELVINYTDGSSSAVIDTNFISVTTHDPQIYSFPAGYMQLEVESHLDSSLVMLNYQVYVQHSGGNTSETFIYVIDTAPNFSGRNRYFLFQNSLGGFDSLWCTGVTSKGIDLERETGELVQNYNYAGTDQQFFQISQEFRNTATINTGYKANNTRAYLDYLQEIIMSDYVYEIMPDGSFSPMSIDDTSIELYKFDDNLFGLTFKARDAFNNVAY